jgi:membrane-bound lytic murein transglycosylase B
MFFPFLNIYLNTITFFILSVILTIFSSVKISHSSFLTKETFSNFIIFKPVIEKLLLKGADSSFIAAIVSDSRTGFNDKYLKINVIGFLNKTDYSNNYDRKSVRKANEFIDDKYEVLNECEEKFGVPKEIITAILWIESKHGSYLGNNHIISVYLSAALADRPEFIEMNIKSLHELYHGDSIQLAGLEETVRKRAAKKSQWALNELLALEEIYRNNALQVLDLQGSWAGAFGMSQFLPSSYNKWAIDGNGDGVIDLFNSDDAIYSIANYLTINGWGNTYQSQRASLYHYNNSNDYVDAVLILAGKLKRIRNWQEPLQQQLEEQQHDSGGKKGY